MWHRNGQRPTNQYVGPRREDHMDEQQATPHSTGDGLSAARTPAGAGEVPDDNQGYELPPAPAPGALWDEPAKSSPGPAAPVTPAAPSGLAGSSRPVSVAPSANAARAAVPGALSVEGAGVRATTWPTGQAKVYGARTPENAEEPTPESDEPEIEPATPDEPDLPEPSTPEPTKPTPQPGRPTEPKPGDPVRPGEPPAPIQPPPSPFPAPGPPSPFPTPAPEPGPSPVPPGPDPSPVPPGPGPSPVPPGPGPSPVPPGPGPSPVPPGPGPSPVPGPPGPSPVFPPPMIVSAGALPSYTLPPASGGPAGPPPSSGTPYGQGTPAAPSSGTPYGRGIPAAPSSGTPYGRGTSTAPSSGTPYGRPVSNPAGPSGAGSGVSFGVGTPGDARQPFGGPAAQVSTPPARPSQHGPGQSAASPSVPQQRIQGTVYGGAGPQSPIDMTMPVTMNSIDNSGSLTGHILAQGWDHGADTNRRSNVKVGIAMLVVLLVLVGISLLFLLTAGNAFSDMLHGVFKG
jgi:hypothetical protein